MPADIHELIHAEFVAWAFLPPDEWPILHPRQYGPSTPRQEWVRSATHPDLGIARWVAANRWCPPELLAWLVDHHHPHLSQYETDLLVFAARNPATPLNALAVLAASTSHRVREAVTRSVHSEPLPI